MSKINAAILAVMKEVGAIAKTQRNKEQGFDFRGIDDVYNRLHPLMVEHGIFTTSKILSKDRGEKKTSAGGTLHISILEVEYTFHADDDSSVTTIVVGEGMSVDDKSHNMAMSGAHKNALLQMFMIPTQDIADGDKNKPVYEKDPATDEQMATVQEFADAGKIPESTLAWIEERDWKLSSHQVEVLLDGLKEQA